jgi:hypothetical protein
VRQDKSLVLLLLVVFALLLHWPALLLVLRLL